MKLSHTKAPSHHQLPQLQLSHRDITELLTETLSAPAHHRAFDGGLQGVFARSFGGSSSADAAAATVTSGLLTPASIATDVPPTVEAAAPPQDRIDALLQPFPAPITVWNTTAQPAVPFTYQFESGPPPDLVGGQTFQGWAPYTTAQKDAVRAVLAEYAEILNVQFIEVTGSSDPDINFGRADLPPTMGGIGFNSASYFVNGNGQVTSKFIDSSVIFDINQNLSTNRSLLLHEIGHALTLKHPGNYDTGGFPPPPPYLPTAEDNNRYTVMSYIANPDNGALADHPMLYDIAALQWRFGANATTRTGNDTYTGPNGLAQTIWDAGGTDTISGAAQVSSVTIDLREGAFSSLGALNNLSIAYGVLIENAIGGSADDTLVGNDAGNALTGNGGADFIQGRGGADNIQGGDGDDWLDGGSGGDTINGGNGTLDIAAYGGSTAAVNLDLQANTYSGGDATGDVLSNVEGLSGSGFNDQLFGDANGNRLFGQGGADFIQGRGGNDLIDGGDGDDWLDGGAGADQIFGGNGTNDIVAYGASTAAVNADLAAFTFTGGDAAGDTYSGVEGVSGSAFNDQLFGDGNANRLFGQGGADFIQGRGGNDLIDGGDGDDWLDGGTGADQIFGGNGTNDIVAYGASTAAVNADLAAFTFTGGDAAGDTYSGVEGVSGSAFGDQLFGDANANRLFGQGGNDFIQGRGGNDLIDGGDGDDWLDGGAGGDQIFGGNGTNDVVAYGASNAAVSADLQSFTFSGGDAAGDTYSGIEGVSGSAFNDTLSGDGNANRLLGQGGTDILAGRGGNDYLEGGTANDTFVFADNGGLDNVADFDDFGDDLIQLSVSGITSFAQVQAVMTQSGADVLIDFATTDILLLNTTLASMGADDFTFV